jgi:hypothetical protein
MNLRTLFFFKPDGTGKHEFIVGIDYKLHPIGIKLRIVFNEVYFRGGVGNMAYANEYVHRFRI